MRPPSDASHLRSADILAGQHNVCFTPNSALIASIGMSAKCQKRTPGCPYTGLIDDVPTRRAEDPRQAGVAGGAHIGCLRIAPAIGGATG